MTVRVRRRLLASLFAIASLWAASGVHADDVQGTVTPATARVEIRKAVDAAGAPVATLGPGAFQIWLDPGSYVAVCRAPRDGRTVRFDALSQPTSVDIDCS